MAEDGTKNGASAPFFVGSLKMRSNTLIPGEYAGVSPGDEDSPIW